VVVGVTGAGAGLLVSVLVTVVAAVGAGSLAAETLADGSLPAPVAGTASPGPGDLLALPVLVWSAAWGGSSRLTAEGGPGGLGASVTYAPLGVTVLVAAAVAALSWRDERSLHGRDPSGLWARAAVTGLAHTGVVAVLAALLVTTVATGIAAGSVTLHAALPRLLLVGSLLAVAASCLGRAAALPANLRWQVVPRALAPAVPALDVVAVHSVTAVVLVTPLALLAALVAGAPPLAALLTYPMWLVNAAAAAAVVGSAGASPSRRRSPPSTSSRRTAPGACCRRARRRRCGWPCRWWRWRRWSPRAAPCGGGTAVRRACPRGPCRSRCQPRGSSCPGYCSVSPCGLTPPSWG
jgi:hypothetical protein